jgi:transposase
MANQEPYPSDVNDREWELLGPLVTVPEKLGRPPRHDRRRVLNAIFYVVRSGCAWRLLPHDLPPWRLCYYYFAEWRENGLWQEINDHLRETVREKHAKKSPQRCDLRRTEC